MPTQPLSPLLWRYTQPGSQAREASRTFVLAPFAGGGVHALADWLPHLLRGGDMALMLRYADPARPDAGRAGLHALADEISASLMDVGSDPLVLIGHSMGAVVAYELAVRLERAGRAVSLLVVAAARPPHLLAQIASQITRSAATDMIARTGFLAPLGATQQHPELLALAAANLQADSQLLAGYRVPHMQLSCRVLALGGLADSDVAIEHLSQWQAVTQARTDVSIFPGGHFFYRGQLAVVCAHIRRKLDA